MVPAPSAGENLALQSSQHMHRRAGAHKSPAGVVGERSGLVGQGHLGVTQHCSSPSTKNGFALQIKPQAPPLKSPGTAVLGSPRGSRAAPCPVHAGPHHYSDLGQLSPDFLLQDPCILQEQLRFSSVKFIKGGLWVGRGRKHIPKIQLFFNTSVCCWASINPAKVHTHMARKYSHHKPFQNTTQQENVHASLTNL